jgi:hypothetical protein
MSVAADGRQGDTRRRRLLCWFPLVGGAIVLPLCWIAMAAMAAISGVSTCFGEPGLGAVARELAHGMRIWDDSGFAAGVGLLIYVAVSLAPFLLLSGCVRLAARGRTTLFLAVLAITGTVFVSLYDILGFWAAYGDIKRGGFLCDMAFGLVPIGGLIAGACAVTIGSLAALAIEWRRRAHT